MTNQWQWLSNLTEALDAVVLDRCRYLFCCLYLTCIGWLGCFLEICWLCLLLVVVVLIDCGVGCVFTFGVFF